jgi:hypothetical protein
MARSSPFIHFPDSPMPRWHRVSGNEVFAKGMINHQKLLCLVKAELPVPLVAAGYLNNNGTSIAFTGAGIPRGQDRYLGTAD